MEIIKKNIVTTLLIALLAFFTVVVVIMQLSKDEVGPTINFNEDIVFTSIPSSNIDYLQGVTAYDKKDGDVTDTLNIESVVEIDKNLKVRVIYVASDNSNNITKKIRFISIDSGVTQEPSSDEEETPTEEETTDNIEETTKGEEETTSDNIDIPVVQTEKPVLTLTTNELKIKLNEEVNLLSYVKDITDDKDTREELFKRISIVGEYNSQVVGNYEIKYFAMDSDGNASDLVVFNLAVEE